MIKPSEMTPEELYDAACKLLNASEGTEEHHIPLDVAAQLATIATAYLILREAKEERLK